MMKFVTCAFVCFTLVEIFFFIEFAGQVAQFGIKLHSNLVKKKKTKQTL